MGIYALYASGYNYREVIFVSIQVEIVFRIADTAYYFYSLIQIVAHSLIFCNMDQGIQNIVLWIVIVLFSASIHEFFHGLVALWQGDSTAKDEGRLTLNPLKHIDPMGSVVIPLILVLTVGKAFGWAKPVPYNPYNLRDQKWGAVYVGLAGPASNFLIALVFGLSLRFMPVGVLAGIAEGQTPMLAAMVEALVTIVLVNIILGLFNLMPIPPLDGSKLLFAVLPPHLEHIKAMLSQYGFILALFFAVFLFSSLMPVVIFLFRLITGMG